MTARGEGNVVSVEFNLLYRWHSTLSEENAEWLEQEFGSVFPKDVGPDGIKTFRDNARKVGMAFGRDPTKWVFGGLVKQFVVKYTPLTILTDCLVMVIDSKMKTLQKSFKVLQIRLLAHLKRVEFQKECGWLKFLELCNLALGVHARYVLTSMVHYFRYSSISSYSLMNSESSWD